MLVDSGVVGFVFIVLLVFGVGCDWVGVDVVVVVDVVLESVWVDVCVIDEEGSIVNGMMFLVGFILVCVLVVFCGMWIGVVWLMVVVGCVLFLLLILMDLVGVLVLRL